VTLVGLLLLYALQTELLITNYNKNESFPLTKCKIIRRYVYNGLLIILVFV